MARLQTNIFANLGGQVWGYLLQLALVPIYLKLLGVEAFGLVALFGTISVTIQVFDLGLAQTMMRELPRRLGEGRGIGLRRAHDLVRTLEIPYWAIAIALGSLLYVVGPFAAGLIIHAEQLSADTLSESLKLMAVALVLQLPANIYSAALSGLQRLVTLNLIRIVMSTIAAAGSLTCLWLLGPTPQVLFGWQIVTAGISLVVIRLALNKHLPPSGRRPQFRLRLLKRIWRFAAGAGALGISGLLLGQADRWILIAILPLREFSVYSIATSVSNTIYGIVSPIYNALFPRLSALTTDRDASLLRTIYHEVAQLLAAAVLPVAFTICLFSREILFLWTRNAAIADSGAPVLRLLALGTGLNGLMFAPFALQLSHGWLRLPLAITTTFIVLLIPLMVVLATRYGGVGAAAVWLTLNVLYVLGGIPLTHRKLLRGDARAWFLNDVLPPALSAGLVVAFVRSITPNQAPALIQALGISAAISAGLLTAGLSAPATRSRLRQWVLAVARF